MKAIAQSLYRYPIKGLSPEQLSEAALEADGHFPGDRLYAIENGPSGFDAKAAEHFSKIKYLMLMRQERLARFKTVYDDATSLLTITQGGKTVAAGQLKTAEGRAAIENFYNKNFTDELRGPAKILSAPQGYRFMDSRSGFLSIIDLASVAAIAKVADRALIDPLRFRANVYVEGLGAWGEFDLVGKQMQLGQAELEITKRIDRCAATDVDPATGIRDLRMVDMLERAFSHHDCGVYARVIKSGLVKPGDQLVPA
jgi:uncharacterized protein